MVAGVRAAATIAEPLIGAFWGVGKLLDTLGSNVDPVAAGAFLLNNTAEEIERATGKPKGEAMKDAVYSAGGLGRAMMDVGAAGLREARSIQSNMELDASGQPILDESGKPKPKF